MDGRKATRITVTLCERRPSGDGVGLSEFLLDRPDEARFVDRARGLFKMVPEPKAPLFVRLRFAGAWRDVDALDQTPEQVAARLWEEARSIGPTC